MKPDECASEFLGTWTEALSSGWRAGRTWQAELIDWWFDTCRSATTPQVWLERSNRLASSLVALTHDAAAEWTRLGSENQRGFWDQLGKSMELARSASAPETEARAAELCQSAQGALRLNVMALLRTNARLAQAWSDFWMPPREGPENHTSMDA